jgi:hypothetical protein
VVLSTTAETLIEGAVWTASALYHSPNARDLT